MRAFAGMALPLMLAGSQGAAAGEIDQPHGAKLSLHGAKLSLSKFDYVVLASMADSQWPISIAMYHPSEVTVELREH